MQLSWEREIRQYGGSVIVRLPHEALKGMGWKVNDKVIVTLEKDNTEFCIRKVGKK